jgi:hypothetical protein
MRAFEFVTLKFWRPNCSTSDPVEDLNLSLKGGNILKTVGLMILLVGAAGFAMAGTPAPTPEIDSASAASAVALLSGALLVIRGRRKK